LQGQAASDVRRNQGDIAQVAGQGRHVRPPRGSAGKPDMTPTALSHRFLRGMGYITRTVERYNAYTRRREDLWGADIIAFKPNFRGVLLVQATTRKHIRERLLKCLQIPEAVAWASAPRHARGFVILGWSKEAASKGKRKIWVPCLISLHRWAKDPAIPKERLGRTIKRGK